MNITKIHMETYLCNAFPTEKYLKYEVLINPMIYNLFWSLVDTMGIGHYFEYYFMPSQPVIAQKPNRFNSYQTTYIAYQGSSKCVINMGTIQKADNLGKKDLYFGLNRVVGNQRVWVLAVGNNQILQN